MTSIADLVASISLADVTGGVLAVGATAVGLLVTVKGVQYVIRQIRGV
jgi:hypothetical protein